MHVLTSVQMQSILYTHISRWGCGEGVVNSGLYCQFHIRHIQLLLASMSTVHLCIL